ncbi:MAG: acryloyl-CoA reductase [Tessaracoccus sp.]|uniref:acrylyl-CoA reductase family protein n=1 Tax=Tessaracoccus sp. TaxID=1971211 RepID=UPI001EBAC4CD|nr:acryloyl-CoA reductase [Tessaracoccus sp.]MBK7819526.1 acryloyl-CoA reductase [Tessaracoccus sp.]
MIRGIVVREGAVALEEFTEEFLGDGDVLVDVAYSDLNYKDALAVTGRPGVVRTTPLIAGIDVVGTVAESDDPRWAPGDTIILNGAGLSETRNGGYATRARIDGALAVGLPEGLTAAQAAALGTAGYTAALSVLRIISEGIQPSQGPVLVTGATGGVGSVATMLLATAGFDVTATTGRVDQFEAYLRDLGAADVLPRADLEGAGRPLQKAVYAAVVDSVGGESLANAIARTQPHGVVTACGLAGSSALPSSVMPFILRGVTLAGIDSVWADADDRADAWRILARGVDLDRLEALTTPVGLDGVIAAGEELLAGKRHGRTLVTI